jgi:hypothetical protein
MCQIWTASILATRTPASTDQLCGAVTNKPPTPSHAPNTITIARSHHSPPIPPTPSHRHPKKQSTPSPKSMTKSPAHQTLRFPPFLSFRPEAKVPPLTSVTSPLPPRNAIQATNLASHHPMSQMLEPVETSAFGNVGLHLRYLPSTNGSLSVPSVHFFPLSYLGKVVPPLRTLGFMTAHAHDAYL